MYSSPLRGTYGSTFLGPDSRLAASTGEALVATGLATAGRGLVLTAAAAAFGGVFGAVFGAATLARAFGEGFAAGFAAAALAVDLALALAFGAGFTGAFAAALATGLAETVFLAFFGLADGFLAGIDGLRGHGEGRGSIQTESLRSSGAVTRRNGDPRNLSGAVARVTFFYTSCPFQSLVIETP